MDDAERDIRILALIHRGEDDLRVAARALEDGRPDLCASRAFRAMHALATAVLSTRGLASPSDGGTLAAFEAAFVDPGHFPPGFAATLREAHRLQQVADGQPAAEVPAATAQGALQAAHDFCYALKEALTQWKQGRALR